MNHVLLHDEKPRPEVRPDNTGFGWVYFLGTEHGTEVKLGYSTDLPTRKKQHETNNGRYEPLETLAVVRGIRADEGVLKSHFKNKRSRPRSDEWLTADEEVRSYLRWLRDQPYVATEIAAANEIDKVDSNAWLPRETRLKRPRQLVLDVDGSPWADLQTSQVMEGDFYTHPRVIRAARQAMGGIDLDPASCKEANKTVGATRFIGERENGLTVNWSGRVWCNPPYGNWKDWAPYIESQLPNIEQMCLLVTTRSITGKTFHPLVRLADSMWVARGRFGFGGPHASAPDEGHICFYYGESPDRFIEAFSEIGHCFLGGIH